jgi:hypothetical protein
MNKRQRADLSTAGSKSSRMLSSLDEEIAKLERDLEGLDNNDDGEDDDGGNDDDDDNYNEEGEEGRKGAYVDRSPHTNTFAITPTPDKVISSLMDEEYRIKPLPKTCLPAAGCKTKARGNADREEGPNKKQWYKHILLMIYIYFAMFSKFLLPFTIQLGLQRIWTSLWR